MGLTDFLFGKDPKDSLPPWMRDFYNNPPPALMDYFRTGMVAPTSSSSSTSSSGTSATKGSQNSQFMNQPFTLPGYIPLENLNRDIVYGRLVNNSLPEGYKNEGLRNIGQAGQVAARSLEDALISRGLGGRTGAGLDVLGSSIAGQQSSFMNELPMLQRDLQNQDLALSQGLIGAFGQGQTGRSSGTNQSLTNTTNQSFTSGMSGGGFDAAGMSGLWGSIMPYMTSGRQGGALNPLLTLLLGRG